MTHYIRESHGIGPARRVRTIATADTLADAIATARAMFDVIDLYIDPLSPLCADFFTADCRAMHIEPYA